MGRQITSQLVIYTVTAVTAQKRLFAIDEALVRFTRRISRRGMPLCSSGLMLMISLAKINDSNTILLE